MIGRRHTVLVCFILLAASAIRAQDVAEKPAFEFRGYVESLTALEFARSLDSGVSSSIIHNRLSAVWNATNELSTHLDLRSRIFYGEDIKRIPNFGEMIRTDPGYLDLSVLWVDTRSLVFHTIADRAFLEYADDLWDVRLGRQRVNWGINTVWNPNDLFNAYNFLDFDYIERPGSDAVRVQYSLSSGSSIEAAYSPSRKANDAIAAGLLKWNSWGYDFQLLGGLYRTDIVGGIGWAGNISEAGLKGEASYFHPRSSEFGTIDALSASITIDHSIAEYYLSLSGLYTSGASDDPRDIASLFARSLSAKNLMPFKYTIYASASKSFTPLLSASFAAIYSPMFNSLILFPTLTYSLAQDVNADLVAESYFNNASGVYRSDANAVFLRINWSFL